MRGLVTAFRTLTILSVPGRDADRMADSLPFFPIVGAVLGVAAAAGAMALARLADWPLGGGLAGAALLAALTRGLHLDGLADTFDALGGGRTIERRLEIMKDPRVGAFGVVALVLVLAAKALAIARLAQFGLWTGIAAAGLVSRTVMVEMACSMPYARASGGTGAAFVNDAGPRHRSAARCWSLLLGVLLLGPWAAAAAACIWGAAALLRRRLGRAFGGVTGDLLGAGCELTETALLTALAIAAPWAGPALLRPWDSLAALASFLAH